MKLNKNLFSANRLFDKYKILGQTGVFEMEKYFILNFSECIVVVDYGLLDSVVSVLYCLYCNVSTVVCFGFEYIYSSFRHLIVLIF